MVTKLDSDNISNVFSFDTWKPLVPTVIPYWDLSLLSNACIIYQIKSIIVFSRSRDTRHCFDFRHVCDARQKKAQSVLLNFFLVNPEYFALGIASVVMGYKKWTT